MKKIFEVTRPFCKDQEIPIISQETERFLKSWISKHKPQRIAEIWSAVGYSTTILAQSMEQYTKYWIIDSREISYPHYRQSVLTTQNYPNTTIYLGNVCYIPLKNYISDQYDLLFIDGRKSETLLYLTQRINYIHINSTIIIDDVIKFKEKMLNCYQFLDNNNIIYKVHQLDHDDGILIIQVTWQFLQALSSLWDPSMTP